MTINNKLHFLLLISATLLAGCSAPPGTGVWVPIAESETPYSRIVVKYDGRAELFVADKETHLLRCFWSANTTNSISMKCVSAVDDAEHMITLQVSDDGNAELSEADKSFGLFRRTGENPSPRE